jgi:hypothetical protein
MTSFTESLAEGFGESALDDSALDDVPEYGSVTRTRGDGDTAAVTDSIFDEDDNYVGDADDPGAGAEQDPALSDSPAVGDAAETLAESFGRSALQGETSIGDAFGESALPDRADSLTADGMGPSWLPAAGAAALVVSLVVAIVAAVGGGES